MQNNSTNFLNNIKKKNSNKESYKSLYSNPINNINSSNLDFGKPLTEHSNNTYYKDSNNGASGNLVGPNSNIFKKYNYINDNSFGKTENLNMNGNYLGGVRYDPVGPLAWGDYNMPEPEKNAFPELCNNISKNSNHPSLMPHGLLKDNNFNNKNNYGKGFNN